MTKAIFRRTATTRECAVCGAAFMPAGPLQIVCRQKTDDGALTLCARTAQRLRWRRANLPPEKAAKYGMTTETMRARFDELLATVHNPAAFDAPARPGKPRRVSLAGAPTVGVTEEGETIYALADGSEVVGWPCPHCSDPSDRRGACVKVTCLREQRRKVNRDWCEAHKDEHTAKVLAARKRRKGDTPPAAEPVPPSGPREKPGPWTTPPPAWEGPLPGAVLPIDVDIPIGHPEKLGSALHAVLTGILRQGQGHDPARPEWSLLLVGEQTSSGWAVWLPDEADVQAVRGRTFEASIRSRACRVTLGARAALRLKAPAVTQTGRHRVRLTTLTPVSMRTRGGKALRAVPQTCTLWTALTVVAKQIGLALPDPTAIGIVRVSHATESVTMTLNQKRGLVATGWSGDVVLDVNPLGRWLLDVATRIGLGGRTAYGLGRITVRDEAVYDDYATTPSPEPWEVVFDGAAEKFAARVDMDLDEAKHALAALAAQATYYGERPNGHEAWRAGDLTLIVQPTTLRTLRVIDVRFDGEPPQHIEEHAVDRFIERILGEGTCSREVARRELALRVARSYPATPYTGRLADGVPDAMLWIGPRTIPRDHRSARLRFVVGTKPGVTAPSVMTVLPLFDQAREEDDVIADLWRQHAA